MEQQMLVIKPKKFKTDTTAILSARVSTELLKRIEKLAEQSNRNKNEMIQILLTYAVDHAVIEEGGK